jgi:hypothetical protein
MLNGTGGTRTLDLSLRRRSLYPSELQPQTSGMSSSYHLNQARAKRPGVQSDAPKPPYYAQQGQP